MDSSPQHRAESLEAPDLITVLGGILICLFDNGRFQSSFEFGFSETDGRETAFSGTLPL